MHSLVPMLTPDCGDSSFFDPQTDAVEQAYAEARKNFLPAFDPEAKEPHLVYDARNMAGDEAWGQVSRVTDACLRQEDENWVTALTNRGGPWHESVQMILRAMPAEAPHAKKYQIKCAILLNHLISFHRQRGTKRFLRGTSEEIAQAFKLPTESASRFLDLFATAMTNDGGQDGYACTKQQNDKCLVHILLLFVMASGRSMKVGSIKPVADDVRIELSEAANLLRLAGFTVKSTGKNAMTAGLTVPLTFPPPRRGRSSA